MYFLNWASENEELTVTGLVACSIVGVFVVGIVFSNIRRIWLGQQQLTLKQTMVEQGMSADEIGHVMKS
jgi:hypothetical protein